MLALLIALLLQAAGRPQLPEIRARIAVLETALRDHQARLRASRPSFHQAYDAAAALALTAEQARAARAGQLELLPGPARFGLALG